MQDPEWVFPVMESWRAEEIKAKFSADHGGKLTESETMFWARLNRVYEGDPDAFEKPIQSVEDAEYERIAAQIAAANAANVNQPIDAESLAI